MQFPAQLFIDGNFCAASDHKMLPVVNPATVCAQIQSAIVFGITAALHREITDGRVEQTNFDTYQIRQAVLPLYFLDSPQACATIIIMHRLHENDPVQVTARLFWIRLRVFP